MSKRVEELKRRNEELAAALHELLQYNTKNKWVGGVESGHFEPVGNALLAAITRCEEILSYNAQPLPVEETAAPDLKVLQFPVKEEPEAPPPGEAVPENAGGVQERLDELNARVAEGGIANLAVVSIKGDGVVAYGWANGRYLFTVLGALQRLGHVMEEEHLL